MFGLALTLTMPATYAQDVVPDYPEKLYLVGDTFDGAGAWAISGDARLVAHYENLETVGYARQIELALPQGVYILRLTGRAVSGETRTRTVKAVVK